MKGQVVHFFELHCLFVGGIFSSYVCWTFAFTRKPPRLRGRLCAMKRIQKKKLFASALRLTRRKCLDRTLLRFGEAGL